MQNLLQLMYQDGHLSSTELAALQRASRQLKENPIKILRSLNIATPGEIRELLQRYYGFSAATDKLIEELDDSLRSLLPADIALHYCALPIAEEDNEIYVLMEDPTDKGTISQLEFLTDKKIVPVIATVQQLSNGLCRLYGVEPGRLKLSGVLEASRGAVGITGLGASRNAHFIDDSQPLLDDEVYLNLKAASKRGRKNERIAALRPQSNSVTQPEEHHSQTDDPMDESSATQLNDATSEPTPTPSAVPIQSESVADSAQYEPSIRVTEVNTINVSQEESSIPLSQGSDLAEAPHAHPHSIPQLEPDFVAAINLLGLSLTLAQSKSEAAKMVNTRLGDFTFTLHLLENNSALIVWNGTSYQVSLANVDAHNEMPLQFKTLLKKIAQCPSE